MQDFYEDVFEELTQYGEIENLNVCDNLADHMVGNVYVKFREEEGAARALQALQGRYYAGRPVNAEFSPVTDFGSPPAGSTRRTPATGAATATSCTSSPSAGVCTLLGPLGVWVCRVSACWA